MKSEFSTKWVGSRQPRKQRKYRANAPFHLRSNMLSAHLSNVLKKKYERRGFALKKGDRVKILRGEFKGKTGKVDSVNMKKLKVVIEGIYRTKKDGSKVSVPLDPSNLIIQELNLDDRKRIKSIEKNSKKEERKVEFKKLPKEEVSSVSKNTESAAEDIKDAQ